MIFQCLQPLRFGAKDDFVAKILETLEQPVCGALWTKSVEVVGPQLSIGVSAANEMVSDDDQAPGAF
jgi:hypothetical protein